MATNISKLCAQVDSPAYIFSEEEFCKRTDKVKQAFGNDVDICFSIKANPFLLNFLPKNFSKVEVCSPGELEICKALGINPEMIIFSGVNKSLEEIRDALKSGVGVITAESKSHIDGINICGIDNGCTFDVLLRLSNESQFGIDGEELIGYIKNRKEYSGINISGIHYFTGTQKKRPSAVIKEIDKLVSFIDRIKEETGFDIQKIEYGTGLAVDYFKDDADDSENERLMEIAPKIRELGEKAELTVEMGRFFAAPCGYYITRVKDIKVNDGVHYAILDGGIHQLKYDGQTQGMQLPQISHIKIDGSSCGVSEETQAWTLCGSLCTTADVIARNAKFTDLNFNDFLVFHRTGAYSMDEGISFLLSRDMPSIYAIQKNGALKLMRRRIDTHLLHIPESVEK